MVFNLFEEVVRARNGEDAWDDLLGDAGVEGAYTSLGSYPDAEFLRLVTAAVGVIADTPGEVIRTLGREAIPVFAARYPELFAPHRDTQSFVLTLNDIIHPEVRKLYPGADVPEFDFDLTGGDTLRMGYRSPRRLCAFAEGLLQGAAAHYGERIVIAQPRCMNRGDDACLLEVRVR